MPPEFNDDEPGLSPFERFILTAAFVCGGLFISPQWLGVI